MSWDITKIEKWRLPDGSVFVIEESENDNFGGFGDHAIESDYGGSDELYNDAMHETYTYFEKNNGNWEIIKIPHKNLDWTKSWIEYKFKSGRKEIDLKVCKRIK